MTAIEVLDVDITTLAVDAITNAANAHMLHGGGVAGAISRAGGRVVDEESRAQAPVPLGEAIATGGGDMPCRHVIHAVTMQRPAGTTSAEIVRACTAATLRTADDLGCRSLALVAFGTGVGGFPLDEAAEIEVGEVRRHIETGTGLQRIVFALHGDAAVRAFQRALDA